MKSYPLVVIIISNYNGASYFYKGHSILWNVFSSLKKTKYRSYKVILADDASTDGSIKYVKTKFPTVSIVLNSTNGGFSKNNNNAMIYAFKKYKPDYILLLNNDIIVVDSLWLNKLVELAESDDKIGLIGCKLVYPDRRIQHAGIEIGYYGGRNIGRGQMDFSQFEYKKEVDGVTFAAALIKKKVIEKIGLLDENFFMGFEDTDYSIRAKKANFKIFYDGDVKLIHLEGFSSTNSTFQKIKLESFFYNQVNFWYFRLKYKSLKQFRGLNKLRSVFIFLFGAIVSIENRNRERKLSNIQLKNKPFIRLVLSIKAIIKARRLCSNTKS